MLFRSPIDKQKVKNRIKTIKYNWSECYDVFKNGLSGFAWSLITKMWSAEPEVWESLIQVCSNLMLSFLFTYYKIIVKEVFVSDCPLSNARLCSSY